MPRVVFTENFDWNVKQNVTIAYKAGGEYLVKQDCADAAIAAGRAVAAYRRKADPDAVQ